MLLSLHVNLSHEEDMTDSNWVLHHLLHVTPTTSATSYQKIKSLKTQKLQTRELYLLSMPQRCHWRHEPCQYLYLCNSTVPISEASILPRTFHSVCTYYKVLFTVNFMANNYLIIRSIIFFNLDIPLCSYILKHKYLSPSTLWQIIITL
jgi:hypothetical protein